MQRRRWWDGLDSDNSVEWDDGVVMDDFVQSIKTERSLLSYLI